MAKSTTRRHPRAHEPKQAQQCRRLRNRKACARLCQAQTKRQMQSARTRARTPIIAASQANWPDACRVLRLPYCALLRLIAPYCDLLRLIAIYCSLLRLIVPWSVTGEIVRRRAGRGRDQAAHHPQARRYIYIDRDGDRDRDRERDSDRETETERRRQRQRQDRDRDKQTNRQREEQTERQRLRQRDTETERAKERERQRDKETERQTASEKPADRDREQDDGLVSRAAGPCCPN